MAGSFQVADFRGRVAAITGAASGIGEALARHAAVQLGMKVVLVDIDEAGLSRLADELRGRGSEVLAVVTDVSDAQAMDRLAEKTQQHFGPVKVLINNAGIETLSFSWEISAAQWDKILNVNIHGIVHGVRAFAPAMIASAEPCIIANLSSIAGVSIAPIQASYVMSKHAVLAFSVCLQLEMAIKQAKVQVSAVLPGPVKTQTFSALDGADDPVVAEHHRAMIELLGENGMSAEQAAQTIFEQLAAGKFWVSTHPEMTVAMAQQRAAGLTSLADSSAFNIGQWGKRYN